MKTKTRSESPVRSRISSLAATTLLALTTAAPLGAYTPRDGDTITLNPIRGGYVTARTTTLTGTAAGDGPAQRFAVTLADNGRVLLRNGQSYLNLDAQGLLRASASRQGATPLRIVPLDGDAIALETRDGRFIRAGIGEQCQLGAVSDHIRSWERFTAGRIADPDSYPILPEGFPSVNIPPPPFPPGAGNGNPPAREGERKITLRTCNGTCLRAGVGEHGSLAASGEQPLLWQTFTLKPDVGGTVQIMDGRGRMLKAMEDGRVFAVAGPGLIVRRDAHRFEVFELANGSVAIKTAFGKYITVQANGSAMATDARVSDRSSFRQTRILAVAQR